MKLPLSSISVGGFLAHEGCQENLPLDCSYALECTSQEPSPPYKGNDSPVKTIGLFISWSILSVESEVKIKGFKVTNEWPGSWGYDFEISEKSDF